MSRQKKNVFVVINLFLLITAVIILAVYAKKTYKLVELWLTVDNAFDLYIDYLKITIFILLIGSNIFTYFITFSNLKKLSISKKRCVCIKIDSWGSVAFALLFCQDDFHMVTFLFNILKVILLRILVSDTFYKKCIKNDSE